MIVALAIALLIQTDRADVLGEATKPEPKPYVSGFCIPFVLGNGEPERLRRLFTYWHARSAPDSEAEAYRPSDADTLGQMAVFPDTDAPHAFVDRQRGTCSLVFGGVHLPATASEDFNNAVLPIGGYAGDQAEHWRRVATKRVGPPGPIRYFIPSSDVVGAGICATAFEDLRLRDNSPVVLVRVSPCRLGPDDTLE